MAQPTQPANPVTRRGPAPSPTAARWAIALVGLLAPLAPASGAGPSRYVELRAGTGVETTAGSGFGAATAGTFAAGLQLREWLEAELSVGVVDATLSDAGIALPGQTYYNRPLSSADVRVVAVPVGLTGRFLLPSDGVRPFLLAGAGFAVAHAVAAPEQDGPIQRDDFVSYEVHLGLGFVAEVTDRVRAGMEVRYLHIRGDAFGLGFELPGLQYAASVGWRF
jgi:opacity protein-like surface antigen